MSNPSRNFPRNHDILLRYSKSDDWFFRTIKGGDSEYKVRFKRYLVRDKNQMLYGIVKKSKDKLITRRIERVRKDLGRNLVDDDVLFDFDKEFKAQSDVFYVPLIKGNAKERVCYPTQKPLALLEKVIEASSNEGDIVLDPFCGCATTCVAAEKHNRHWIGIDFSEKAIELTLRRFREHLGLLNPRIIERYDIPVLTASVRKPTNLYTSKKAEFKKMLYGKQGGNCAGCETHFNHVRHFHFDHIIPRVDGGGDNDANIQLLCGSCNSIKGDRSMGYLMSELRKIKESRRK